MIYTVCIFFGVSLMSSVTQAPNQYWAVPQSNLPLDAIDAKDVSNSLSA
jgi:hypothetical protein